MKKKIIALTLAIAFLTATLDPTFVNTDIKHDTYKRRMQRSTLTIERISAPKFNT